MKIENMTDAERTEAIKYITDGMSKDEAIAKVTGEEFTAEVEVIDARPVKEEEVEAVGEVVPFDAGQAPVEYKPIRQESHKLTMDEIKKYICPDATDAEAYTFMQLCNARGLNPFTKEAYLVKYKGQKTAATVIVGKDAFTKKAGQHPMFDGYEAGIIVQSEVEGVIITERREGTFSTPDEEIVGGWSKVYRKDCTHPFMNEVSFREYVGMRKNNMNGKMEPNTMWSTKPGTMIRKVALVQSLREAFTEDLGGCYDSAEMGDVQ